MEGLTTKQSILLNVLVTLIVSMTVSIFTVYSLDRSATSLPQSMNRIIERTVREVVSGTSTPEEQAITTDLSSTNDQPLSDEEIRVAALAKNVGRTATLYSGATKLGDGVVISRTGMVAFDRASLGEAPGDVYVIAIRDKRYPASVISAGNGSSIALLQLALGNGEQVPSVVPRSRLAPQGSTLYLVEGAEGDLAASTFVARVFPLLPGGRILGYSIPVAVSRGTLAIDRNGDAAGIVIQIGGQMVIVPLDALGKLASDDMNATTTVPSANASTTK